MTTNAAPRAHLEGVYAVETRHSRHSRHSTPVYLVIAPKHRCRVFRETPKMAEKPDIKTRHRDERSAAMAPTNRTT